LDFSSLFFVLSERFALEVRSYLEEQNDLRHFYDDRN